MTNAVNVEPAAGPALWWELYLALADHGHHHPALQPVEIRHPSSELVYEYPAIVASLEIVPHGTQLDATALADWVESMDVVYTVTTRPALGHVGDVIAVAVGLLGSLTVSVWTVVRGTTVFAEVEPVDFEQAVGVTIAALRAHDEVRHAHIPPGRLDPPDTAPTPEPEPAR